MAEKLHLYNTTDDPHEAASSWLPRIFSPAPPPPKEEEVEGLMGFANKAVGKAKGAVAAARETVEEYTISRTRWMQFFIGLALGTVLMGLAMFFLPVMILAPQKFSLLFTAGSLCFMGSFSVLKGHKKFMEHLLTKDKMPFTIAYFGSMIGTIWAAEYRQSYIMTLGFCIGQIIALAYFLVSYIPGGTRGLTFFGKILGDAVGRLCCCCCSSAKSSLPL